ncbi:hypothetical protein Bbelb_438910 [Branchiostoma belcheri]|nr:hypothetical protein Bbelb_440310 [Branchiostoma belcheri]KAI8478373.1 hypothetical protein Bbelb_438910 [Branchiostoma belcheri]
MYPDNTAGLLCSDEPVSGQRVTDGFSTVPFDLHHLPGGCVFLESSATEYFTARNGGQHSASSAVTGSHSRMCLFSARNVSLVETRPTGCGFPWLWLLPADRYLLLAVSCRRGPEHSSDTSVVRIVIGDMTYCG